MSDIIDSSLQGEAARWEQEMGRRLPTLILLLMKQYFDSSGIYEQGLQQKTGGQAEDGNILNGI